MVSTSITGSPSIIPTKVFLGLGSNLGDRAENLATACVALSEIGLVVARSSLYETAPLYVTEQPEFLNMVVCLETTLSPLNLLEFLKQQEAKQGRVASCRYGPRVIDLDILLYGNSLLNTPILTVPHLLLAERGFVLVPLAEIAADVIHPVLNLDIATLLERLSNDEKGIIYDS